MNLKNHGRNQKGKFLALTVFQFLDVYKGHECGSCFHYLIAKGKIGLTVYLFILFS